MDTTSIPNMFRKYIERGIKEEIEKIVDEEAKEAAARVERRVRAKTPEIAMSIFDTWTATWENKTTLAIRVEFKEQKVNA